MLPTIRTVRYCYHCMYRGFTDMKPLGCSTYSGVILQYVLAQLHGPLFHNTFHMLHHLIYVFCTPICRLRKNMMVLVRKYTAFCGLVDREPFFRYNNVKNTRILIQAYVDL